MLILFDGSNLAHRSLYACKRDLGYYSYRDAIHYFLKSMATTLKKNNLEAGTIVAWDKGIPLHRRELLSEYKPHCTPVGDVSSKFLSNFNKNEDKIEDELNNGFIQEYSKLVKILHSEILPRCKCVSSRVENVEADDIIAFCCYYLKDEEKLIVSSDRDLIQLVDETTSVYSFNSPNSNSHIYDIEWVMENYTDNFKFRYLLEKAILGDGSDNIPGVEYIGDKSAKQYVDQILDFNLVQKFSLDDSIKKLEKPPRVSKKGHGNLVDSSELIIRNILIMDLYYPITHLQNNRMSYNIQKDLISYLLYDKDYYDCMDELEELEELQFNSCFSSIDKIFESNCNFDTKSVLEKLKNADC